MVGWHHRFNGHELEQTPGDGEGQEGLVSCSPWGHRDSNTIGQLNNNKAGICHNQICMLKKITSISIWRIFWKGNNRGW